MSNPVVLGHVGIYKMAGNIFLVFLKDQYAEAAARYYHHD